MQSSRISSFIPRGEMVRKWMKILRILVNIAEEIRDLWDAIWEKPTKTEESKEPETFEDELLAKFKKLENTK